MELIELIDECGLICPYEDDVVTHLANACNNYLESLDLDESQFCTWALCYIKGTYSEGIRNSVESYLQDQDLEEMYFPECVWNALTFYCIYNAIVENRLEKQKAIFSCSLQNLLLSCKGHWNMLNYQKYLLELYGKFDQYLVANEVGKGDVSEDFVSSLYDDTFEFDDSDEENLENLQVMGKYTWLYKLEHYREFMNHGDGKNIFLRVIYFLDYWYKENPSLYINMHVKKLMEIVGAQKSNARKSLKEIVSLIPATDDEVFDEPTSKSSLIVKMVNDRKIVGAFWVDEKMTCQEFFVYLYYELLLELKLKENDGE